MTKIEIPQELENGKLELTAVIEHIGQTIGKTSCIHRLKRTITTGIPN